MKKAKIKNLIREEILDLLGTDAVVYIGAEGEKFTSVNPATALRLIDEQRKGEVLKYTSVSTATALRLVDEQRKGEKIVDALRSLEAHANRPAGEAAIPEELKKVGENINALSEDQRRTILDEVKSYGWGAWYPEELKKAREKAPNFDTILNEVKAYGWGVDFGSGPDNSAVIVSSFRDHKEKAEPVYFQCIKPIPPFYSPGDVTRSGPENPIEPNKNFFRKLPKAKGYWLFRENLVTKFYERFSKPFINGLKGQIKIVERELKDYRFFYDENLDRFYYYGRLVADKGAFVVSEKEKQAEPTITKKDLFEAWYSCAIAYGGVPRNEGLYFEARDIFIKRYTLSPSDSHGLKCDEELKDIKEKYAKLWAKG